MTEIPDPGIDFEGFCEAMLEEAKREQDAVPPEERSAYHLTKALAHLVRVYELDAPEIMIHWAWWRARRHLRIARREARDRRRAGRA